jgi:Mn2+/Fe2+ NRAMP family transporter
LSAAVVGSGELIATTALGARAGYSLLWVVLASCLVKVTVQLEYGRHCIIHACTSLRAWNADDGPRLRTVHWSVYAALLFLMTTWFGAAGMMGAAAEVISQMSPGAPLGLWMCILVVLLSTSFRKYGLVFCEAMRRPDCRVL